MADSQDSSWSGKPDQAAQPPPASIRRTSLNPILEAGRTGSSARARRLRSRSGAGCSPVPGSCLQHPAGGARREPRIRATPRRPLPRSTAWGGCGRALARRSADSRSRCGAVRREARRRSSAGRYAGSRSAGLRAPRDRSLLLSGSGAGFVRQPPSTTGVSATPLKRLPFPRAGVTRSAAGAHQLVGAGGATLGCRTRDALDGGVTVVEVTKQTGEVAGLRTVWLEGKPTARDAESPAIL
jgi:hypothetical protein